MNLVNQIKEVSDVMRTEIPELPGGVELHHYRHIATPCGRQASLALPGLFVEATFTTGLSRDEGWKSTPADISVGFLMTTHVTNLQEAAEIRDTVLERVFNVALAHGWAPTITYIGADASQDPRAWAVMGLVCIGPCAS